MAKAKGNELEPIGERADGTRLVMECDGSKLALTNRILYKSGKKKGQVRGYLFENIAAKRSQ